MKKGKKVITGTDIAYYSSILAMVCSVVLFVYQFINKTNEWETCALFFLIGFIGYNSNKEERRS